MSKRDPMSQTQICWIRRDIHLHDNQALQAACQGADHLVPLFIIEPNLINTAAHQRRAFSGRVAVRWSQ